MHPGLWLAFGDLNGIDFWRNKAPVRQSGSNGAFTGARWAGSWWSTNYENPGGGDAGVRRKLHLLRFSVAPEGYLITAKSSFSSQRRLLLSAIRKRWGLACA